MHQGLQARLGLAAANHAENPQPERPSQGKPTKPLCEMKQKGLGFGGLGFRV